MLAIRSTCQIGLVFGVLWVLLSSPGLAQTPGDPAAPPSAPANPLQVEYLAFQSADRVTVIAYGTFPTSGYSARLKRLSITVFPPQFRLEVQAPKPGDIVLQVLTPFLAANQFPAKDPVTKVIVHGHDGQHDVPVVQIPTEVTTPPIGPRAPSEVAPSEALPGTEIFHSVGGTEIFRAAAANEPKMFALVPDDSESTIKWTIQIKTAGGFTGVGRGTINIASNGDATVTSPGQDPRSGKLTKKELRSLNRAIGAARPDRWSSNYPGVILDGYKYDLTLVVGGDGPSPTTHQVSWSDGALGLPNDLRKLASSIVSAWRRLETGPQPKTDAEPKAIAEPQSFAAPKVAGTLHRIDVRAEHPRSYKARMGDIVQCYYLLQPNEPAVATLSAGVSDGDSVKIIGIVDSSAPDAQGSEYSVYVIPAKLGVSYVEVTPLPVSGTSPTKPYRVPLFVIE